MKNLFKKSLLVLIGVLITSLTSQVWGAEAGVFYSYFKYEINGSEYTISREYYNTDDATTDVGTVTSSLKFKAIYIKVWNNSGGNICGGHMGYTLDNWTTTQYYATDTWSGWNIDGVSNRREISKTMETSIASSTDASGKYSIPYFWKVWGDESGSQCNHDWINNNNGYNFHIEYTILPPNATAITTTPSGHISGSGTSDDPYIIPHDGSFTITLSGSAKERTDANSDVQYSVDGGETWGTTSIYTSKTFSNVTAIDVQNYVFKARCYNSADGLESPTITTKTVYYKTAPWSIAGSMNSWSTTANPIAHYSSGTGYAEMTLEANTAYTFKLKDRTKNSDDWFGFDTPLTYSDNGSSKSFTTGGGNCTINTAGKGTYRFTWSGSAHTLTVTYPTSYTVTFGYGAHGSSVTASGSGSGSITSGQYVKSGENVEFSESHDTGYSLKGWYTTADGNTAVSTMSSTDNVLNSIGANANVYAQYTENQFNVTASASPAAGGSVTPSSATSFGQVTGGDITADENDGYEFSGWSINTGSGSFDDDSEADTKFYPTEISTIVATFSPLSYTVTLDAEGGSDGTEEVTATFDDDMPSATMPSRDHYDFEGYFASAGGSGTQYYNSDGTSANAWDVAANTTIYAYWIEKKHTVSIEYKYGATTIHDAGSVSNVGEVTSTAVSALDISGYTFTGWTLTTGVTSTDGLTSGTISIKAFDDDLTITANYEPATYEADLLKVDGDDDGAYSVKVGDTELTIGKTPEYDGYHVYGYYLGYNPLEELDKYSNRIADAEGALVASVGVYTDESGKWKYEGAPDLYTRWLPNNYTIKLMRNDGTDDYTTSTVDMGKNNYTPTITVPERSGYSFDGYFTGSSSGTKVINADGSKASTSYIDGDGNWQHAENVTLYAHWTANPYTITLNNQSATTAGSTSISVTFDATTNLTGTPAIDVPEKNGYTFGGYYTAVAGGGVQVIAANGYVNAQAGGDDTYTSSTKQWKYPNNTDLYAKWTQTISFDQNDATVNGTTSLAATYNGALSPGGITNPNKIGYAFAGWATAADGDVVIEPNGTVNTVADWTDGSGNWIHAGESELVATWTADVNNFKADAATTAWGTADNWSQNKVPTEYTEVHIKGNATVSSHVYVGKVVIEEGTLTIASTGALEVAGTITNTDEDKLVVNSRGALIFDNSAGSTYATVELSTTYASAGSHFQFIGLPVWGVSVSSAFAGKGVYTYAWKQGEGWERRGYYDDLMAFEAIALMGSSGYTFHGALVPTTDKEYSLSYADRENGDVYMYGNSWTAPIKVSGMTIDSYDGAHIYDGSTGSWDGAVSGDVIPAMQAFAVLAKSGTGGSVSIPYNTAVRNATSPNAPLRAPQRNTSDILDHISVYVSGNELQTRMRLFENEQFTNEIDNGYEAIHMEGEGRAGELYAQADDKMTVLATPNLEGTVVGFIPGEATNYTISFEGDGKGYYLNDVVTNQSTLIAEGNTYMFTPDESTNDTRFIISKTPIHNMPTSVDAINDGVKARKQMINGILYIIRDGRLYDATGALVK